MMQGKYLKKGYVVVAVGARGRNTPGGRGKASATLVASRRASGISAATGTSYPAIMIKSSQWVQMRTVP